MADADRDSAKPRSLYVGPVVMAGVAIISGVDSGVAAAFGSDTFAHVSLGTAFSCAFAALGSLVYELWRGRRASS